VKYKVLLVVLWFLNLYDAISTLLALNTGFAKEANPLMRELITASPLGFLIFKVVLGTFILMVMLKRVNRLPSKICIVFLVTLYSLVAVWNSNFWILYFNGYFVNNG
jgi:hypothetical protein